MKVLRPTTIPFPNNGQFIRNSTATYIEDGILKTAAINEPRWQDGKLLLEGEATNLLLRSSDFSNPYWTNDATVSFVAGQADPFGGAAAVKISEAATTGAHVVYRVGVGAAGAVSASFFVKAAERSWVRVSISGVGAYFDLSAGAVGSVEGGVSAQIAPLNGGWFRVVVSRAVTSAASIALRIASGNGVDSYLGVVGSGVLAFGAQLEQASTATSYIPTTTDPVTRAADVCVGNFSRASSGTYIDSSGVLQTASVNVPRIQDGKLLIEGEATNLAKQSSDFYDSIWLKEASAVVTSNTAIAPDGTTTADRLQFPTGTLAKIYQTEFPSNVLTFSVWLKSNTGLNQTIRLYLREAGYGVVYGELNANVTPEWNRFYVTADCSVSSGGVWALIYHSSVGDPDWDIVVWGAQVEVGSQPTSYIPTTSIPVTRAADVHTAGLVYTNATDARPLWSSATTYSVGQIIRYNNTVYESLQAANLNKQPDTNPTWWLSLGADNISAAFDGKVGSKTTATDKLRMIVYPGTNVDAVGYLETNAIIVNTSVVDSNRELVYSNSTGITEDTIENWYDYFFLSPLSDPASQVVHQGINQIDPRLFLGIEMIRPGVVEVGSILTGLSTTFGKTQYGLKAGIVDYSKKETDEFGNVSIVQRPYSKRMQGDVYVNNYDLNKVQRFLYNIRATPVLWMASDDPNLAEVSYVYGFYKDFSTTISYPDVSMCNLEIEGLI